MKNRGIKKLISFLMILCLAMGMGVCAGSLAQSVDGEFEALLPLMDLVCTASWHSPNAPERVPDADGELSLSFIDAFFTLGQKYGSETGVTEAMLGDVDAQRDLLARVFAAKLPELQPVTAAIEADAYVGFQPVLVNNRSDDQAVQLIGEIYLADKALRNMTEADYPSIQWVERAVFTFAADENALNGFRLTGYSVGTDLSLEESMQGYYDEIAVEYESNLGFTILYPSAFTDELLVEDENGVSAVLADGSAGFFAKRILNANNVSLADQVSLVANDINGCISNVYDEMQYGTVSYTTDDGYAVFEVYIVTGEYIYQAQLRYLTSMMSEFGMYNAYIENSFVVNELSQG